VKGTDRQCRDYPTAARLARWAACIHFLGGDTGIGTAAVTRHLRLCGGDSPRMELDTAIAEHLAPARPDAP
jgi:hypothetical protein